MRNKKLMVISIFLFMGNLSFSSTLNFDSINGTGKFVNAKTNYMKSSKKS
jgi:hypothetical protein